MIEFLRIVTRALSLLPCAIAVLAGHLTAAPRNSRGLTFFGTHVQPGFIESNLGRAILNQYRQRLGLGCLAAAVVSLLVPVALAAGASCLLSSFIVSGAFAMANRRVRREAESITAPRPRAASLLTGTEPPAFWLNLLDGVAIIAPPAIPAATLLVLATSAHTNARFLPLSFGLILGLGCAVNHWVLRFRARSSDWAPSPGQSHKYRTYLGAMQSLVFTFMILELCATTLLRHIDKDVWFPMTFAAEALWIFSIFKMHAWLRKNMARESVDPMADTCWKWGCAYFNANDPAVVVPLRAGVGQSFNYAKAPVWIVCGIVTAMSVAVFVQAIPTLAHFR